MADIVNVFAGIPAINRTLFHRIRFSVGDPIGLIEVNGEKTLILRDIEMERAKSKARVQKVHCPADFTPTAGLSGDRETATAQSLAECLVRKGIQLVNVDRSLPCSFLHELQQRDIEFQYHPNLGVTERRAKDDQEIDWLKRAQSVTAETMTRACQLVAHAEVSSDGTLLHDGAPLTSERLQTLISVWLLDSNYSNPGSIVAAGPEGADCHNHGSGPLSTNQPVIIDIFPCDNTTFYNGDCTRTVVNGTIPDEVARMHAAVFAAKAAGMQATRPGVTGEHVHRATIGTIEEHGFLTDRPSGPMTNKIPSMTHGTGHGIGLDVHEPPLLDFKGPVLVKGDALTIEPGLYSPNIGGVRLEDLVVVTADGCESLNADLPEGLDWK